MKRMLWLCMLLAAAQVHAQDNTQNRLLSHVPRQALRFSPFHLLGHYPSLEFSAEQRLYRQITLVGEYGHVLNYSNTNQFSHRRGYKTKVELRYYIHQVKRLSLYGAAEFYWNDVKFERWAQYRSTFEDLPIITKFPYAMTYNEHGFAVKGGFLLSVPGRIFFDFNVGLRMRVIDYDKPQLGPGMTDAPSKDDFAPNENDRIAPGIVLGVRVGYRFR